ncbi:TPA: 30S ribosomal protein S17 [Candidatus Woesearchaeota archaeon]|nr:30S ribosomal protein S17P [uncultured archaeon]AJS12093.1 small subunit ribosomal protein S17 [uncultured archaeon]KHO51179.1 MAG: small subunit ribosomal protein S17 [archaeon GW2011_AR16]HIG96373.1 30S ribosomal protein S17 [Candidatus Woesearchaeota archaeon]
MTSTKQVGTAGTIAPGVRNTGLAVALPSQSCNDHRCPFHGSLTVRKRNFIGTVLSAKAQKSATVGWERRYYIPKYERYEKRKTKLQVHNPPCLDVKQGEIVKIVETRPLSKTKNFVVIEKLGVEKKVRGEDVTLKEEKAEKSPEPGSAGSAGAGSPAQKSASKTKDSKEKGGQTVKAPKKNKFDTVKSDNTNSDTV